MKFSIATLVFALTSSVLGVPVTPTPANGGTTTGVQTRQIPSPLNLLLAFISQLFPVNILVQDIDNLIEDAENIFAELAGFETNENDLISGNCGSVVIIFARGTSEPGNVGSLVGPPLFDAVRQRLNAEGKTLAVQGVDDYEADVTGFLEGGDANGSQRMATLAAQAHTQCPSAKVVLSGYSQGAQVVHNAAKLLSSSAMSDISSIVLFGDPDDGYSIQGAASSNVLTICHEGDSICDHDDLILLPHLTYLIDANTAADFIMTHVA